MKHVFIINPTAGKSNQSKELSEQIKIAFDGYDYIIELTKEEYHATELVKQYASSGEDICFYACGGDGTLNEVVNGIYGYPNAKLAIVPIGTGNDFIKYFSDYTIDDFLNLKNYHETIDVPSDLLTCNGRICLNIASVGFDASVVQKVERFKRLPFVNGKVAYLLSVFNCFLSSMKFRHSLVIDGETIPAKDYIFVVAANATYYGGGFNPTPSATIDDGLIDVLTINALSRLRVVSLISKYKAGKHLDYDFVTHKQCKKIQILSEKEVILNMDGEVTPEMNPEITLLSKAITLVLPKK